jgi:uncharacterized protein (UPF0332 family)
LKLDVELHLRRARRLLTMVLQRVEEELPEVIAHTAYYAMYHAALAALVHAGVPVPKTHSGMVARFTQQFRGTTPDANEQSARLSRGLQRRLIADYEADDTLTLEHARAARDDATAFIAFCERLTDRSS